MTSFVQAVARCSSERRGGAESHAGRRHAKESKPAPSATANERSTRRCDPLFRFFSVLDDAMANWFFLQGARGFTAKAEIRYRAPMPVGATATIECTVVKRKGRLLQLEASATDKASGTVFAESSASFMLKDGGPL